MHIDRIIASADRPVFSFEFFPPKTDEGERNLREALVALKDLEPDFASVTYGAGGSGSDRTLGVTKWLKAELGIEAMAHLTCVGQSTSEVRARLSELQAAGIENVLALRGDPPKGETEWQAAADGLDHAADLAALIGSEYGMGVGAACFPEVHPQAVDPLTDLQHLKAKVDSGARFLITQLFFDNEFYFRFVDAARFAGITVPIIPGVMPITNAKQIQTITELSGAALPPALVVELERRADDPESAAELGVAYATLQCAELLAGGAPGIHFYTLNRSPATRAILSALKLLQPWRSAQAPLREEAERSGGGLSRPQPATV